MECFMCKTLDFVQDDDKYVISGDKKQLICEKCFNATTLPLIDFLQPLKRAHFATIDSNICFFCGKYKEYGKFCCNVCFKNTPICSTCNKNVGLYITDIGTPGFHPQCSFCTAYQMPYTCHNCANNTCEICEVYPKEKCKRKNCINKLMDGVPIERPTLCRFARTKQCEDPENCNFTHVHVDYWCDNVISYIWKTHIK